MDYPEVVNTAACRGDGGGCLRSANRVVFAHRSGQGCAHFAHREAAVAFTARMSTPE
jgi:hypothetical protein